MAVVVNNDGTTGAGNGAGNLLAVALVIVFILAVLYFVLPALRGAGTGTPSVSLPGTVNVNTK
jgi:hypothetical protein